MELSLVLATYNNALYLRDLLNSLTHCRHPDYWEMIIVDNGSSDNTREVVTEYSDQLPITYLSEERKGKSHALNFGIRHAIGEVILFTDDDVIPDVEWLTGHIRAMREHPEANIIGGKILIDDSTIPRWLNKSWNLKSILASQHYKGDAPVHYAEGDYPFGPNMSVRRSSLTDKNSPWPEDIGPGTQLPVGDETAFCRKVSDSSTKDILYHPSCIVEHRPRIGSNFFTASVRRCYIAGQVVALFGLPPSARAGASRSFIGLAILRLSRVRSIQELICIAARAAGYYCGRFRIKESQKRLLPTDI